MYYYIYRPNFFTVVFAPIFAWLAYQYYERRIYAYKGVRILWSTIVGLLFGGIFAAISWGFFTSFNIVLGIIWGLSAFGIYKLLVRCRTEVPALPPGGQDPRKNRAWDLQGPSGV